MIITCAIPTCSSEPRLTVRLANHQTMMVCANHLPVVSPVTHDIGQVK